MNQTNFSDILDRAPSEVEKPKPLPAGKYSTVLVGVPRYDKSAKKQTPFVEFQLKLTAAGEDVDQDDLKNALAMPDGTSRRLTDIVMKHTLYLTEGSAWRLKEFLGDCGFDVDDGDTSMREMIEQTAGRSVDIYIKHTPSQDGKSIFAEIASTLASE